MQQLVQGEGSIKRAAEILIKAGHRSLFLIAGKHFFDENDLSFLHGITVKQYTKLGSNVEEEEISIAYSEFQQSDATALLSIGGGSVMDLGKAIIYSATKASAPIPFFIAAPTTSGSGSEATAFAVVYKKGKKESLVNDSLLPVVVILDPELTYSLSSYQTAVSGMDALSQAIESYWNRNATGESKQFAEKAINLWKKYFLTAVKNGNDAEARKGMQDAAYYAGKAINITRTTGPHALSYFLTAKFNVPHGQAVSLFLPAFFIYNLPGKELCSLLGVKDAVEASTWIKDIMKQAGMATSLAALGINKKEILNDLLGEVNEERFANNPAAFDRSKLYALLDEQI
ncbi:MAG TPA: phosphonoacetaldehyde reductase [Chitinophagaceae bacterium]